MAVHSIIESPVGAEVMLDGRRFTNFGGSSYLGLSGRSQAVDAGIAALALSGAGYQFNSVFEAATPGHAAAEEQAARFFDTEAALFLSGGYLAALAMMAGVARHHDVVFYDSLSHFALKEGVRASGLPHHAFAHLDVANLEEKIRSNCAERPLIVTDGLFSLFGEIAPADALAAVARKHNGRLLVDESHSFGVLGPSGRGICEHFGLSRAECLSGGSTGKALGACGGLILGTLNEVACFRATPAGRGASAGLPAAAAACAVNLEHIAATPWLLTRLRENTAFLKKGMRALGLSLGGDEVAPVAAFSLDSGDRTRRLHAFLREQGFYVLHSNYIGAPEGGVIRCGIFADHDREHLEQFLYALGRAL